MAQETHCDIEIVCDNTVCIQSVQKQRIPVGYRVPSPAEETPRLKCRDCGAFGHTARSKRCPIKCWDGAMTPQLWNLKKEKENRDPRKRQNSQGPGALIETEKDKKEREKLEQQRKALLLRFPKKPQERKHHNWKDLTHSGDYVRRPSRPKFIHVNRKFILKNIDTNISPIKEDDKETVSQVVPPKDGPDRVYLPLEKAKWQNMDAPNTLKLASEQYGQDPALSENVIEQSTGCSLHLLNSQSPAQCSEETEKSYLYPATHTNDQDTQLSLTVVVKKNVQVPIQIFQNTPKKQRLSQSPQKSTERPVLEAPQAVPSPSSTTVLESKESPEVSGITQQPPHSSPNSAQPCTESNDPLSNHSPGQSLRMVFTRLDNASWSSQFLKDPLSHPPEKQTSAKSLASLEESKGSFSWVPLRSS